MLKRLRCAPSDMSPVEPGNSENERLGERYSSFNGSKSAPSLHVSFGLYEFNLQAHELLKGGLRLKIPRQSFQILAMLLEKPGEVVSREDLRRKLWPGDVFVNFEASLNSAVQRLRSALQDTSAEPRYIETLPRVGYRFIADVDSLVPVSKVPVFEIQVSDEALQRSITLESTEFSSGGTSPSEFSTAPPGAAPGWNERIGLLWAAAAVLVVLAGAYGGYRYSRRHRPVFMAQAQASLAIPSGRPRRSVAVMGFTNASGNARDIWLSTAFTEMLATELAAGDHLRAVPEEDVARAKLELSLSNKDSYSDTTLAKIRKDIGCDYVVTGSYVVIGKAGDRRLRLDARVQDAVTGNTAASVAVAGSQSGLFDLASQAGEQLRARLGVGTLTSIEAQEAKLALPSNPEAARLYSDGLAKLRLYDDVAASDLLEKVIHLQPEYSPAYSALATAWSDLGYDAKAAVAARKAMNIAQNLPEQARLQTEARYHEMNGDWAQSVEIYSRLQRSYPDHLDYGLNLAAAQDAVGKSTEAAATLAALRKSASPERDDPRIDITEAGIANHLADYKREQALANDAARKAEINGASLLLARAKLISGSALFFLGDLRGAAADEAEAQRIFAEAGDLGRSARASMDIGGILATQGDIAGAEQSIERSLTVFRRQRNEAGQASALSNLGSMHEIEGDLPKAEVLFREAAGKFAKLNRMNERDTVICNLAEVLERRGKLGDAKDMLEPHLEHLRNGSSNTILGTALQVLGSIAETQGDMPTALRMYQEAAVHLKPTGDKTDYTSVERSLGKAYLRGGDFISAKQTLSEALALDRQTGAKTDMAMDQVELEEVRFAQAGAVDRDVLQSAIDQFRLQKITEGEIEAEIVLARENIREAKTAESAKMLGQTTVLSAKSYNPTVLFDVALANAELQAAQHGFDEARRIIQPALAKAMAVGCVRCQLEARLELGEIEIQSGHVEQGHAQMRELADEAGHRGFQLIADRAAANAK